MPIRREKPIEPLTEDELDRLIAAAPESNPSGARARALVSLLAYAGLRVGEALAVRPQDVDLEAGTVNVLRGKGHRQRIAALLPEGAVHIENWMEQRARAGLNGSHPLLCTISTGKNVLADTMEPGAPLGRPYVHRLLQRLAERAEVTRRVHAHGLRHSHAHILASRGKLVTDIRDQLGHSNLATTSGYLDSFAPAGRIERLRAC